MMEFNPPRDKILNNAVNLVVSASKTAFKGSLVCVTLKGSAVRGDFIQGYSDFDFHVFLKHKAMDGERIPKVEGALQFQKAFGNIDPEEFGVSQFQIYFIDSENYPHDWVPPVEGTYRICWGNLPSAGKEIDNSTYLQNAKRLLLNVDLSRKKLVERFVDKPNNKVPSIVRLLGATLKGYMYSVSILLTSEPKIALKLTLDKLLPVVEDGIGSKGHFSKFFDHIFKWALIKQDYKYAREAFREGIRALDELHYWNLTCGYPQRS